MQGVGQTWQQQHAQANAHPSPSTLQPSSGPALGVPHQCAQGGGVGGGFLSFLRPAPRQDPTPLPCGSPRSPAPPGLAPHLISSRPAQPPLLSQSGCLRPGHLNFSSAKVIPAQHSHLSLPLGETRNLAHPGQTKGFPGLLWAGTRATAKDTPEKLRAHLGRQGRGGTAKRGGLPDQAECHSTRAESRTWAEQWSRNPLLVWLKEPRTCRKDEAGSGPKRARIARCTSTIESFAAPDPMDRVHQWCTTAAGAISPRRGMSLSLGRSGPADGHAPSHWGDGQEGPWQPGWAAGCEGSWGWNQGYGVGVPNPGEAETSMEVEVWQVGSPPGAFGTCALGELLEGQEEVEEGQEGQVEGHGPESPPAEVRHSRGTSSESGERCECGNNSGRGCPVDRRGDSVNSAGGMEGCTACEGLNDCGADGLPPLQPTESEESIFAVSVSSFGGDDLPAWPSRW